MSISSYLQANQRLVRLSALLLVVCSTALESAAVSAATLLTVSPRDAILREVDAATGTTLRASVTLSLAGEPEVRGANGLARHPTTGDLYALVKVPGSAFRLLVTVDESTGVTTRVGPTGSTGDLFAGMAFTDDGTLFAVTGDGALTFAPESLCTLSLVDGSASCVTVLGNGSDGETLGFHPPSGMLYHASGLGVPNDSSSGEILETVNPLNLVVTPVTLSGYDYTELTALAFDGGLGLFAADLGDELEPAPQLLRITSSGAVTLVGPLDHVAKGIVVQPGGVEVPVAVAPWLAAALASTAIAKLRARSGLRRPGRRDRAGSR